MFVFLTVFKSENGTLERSTPIGKLKKKMKPRKNMKCLKIKRQTVSVKMLKIIVPVLIASVDVQVQS